MIPAVFKLRPDDLAPESRPLGERPEFNLIYLAFYFFPWLWITPSKTDVLVALAAVLVFLPVYFHAHRQRGYSVLTHIGIISLIGFLVSPFVGSHGVYHIYASVLAAFIRPERVAWIILIVLACCYALICQIMSLPWWDLAFPLFLAFPIAVGCMSTAERQEREAIIERSRASDQHLATLAERERIAQDLHDLLGQTLTLVTLKSEVAARLFDRDPKRAKQEIDEIHNASRTALKDVRDAVENMNKTTLARELQRARMILSQAGVQLTVNGALPELSPANDKTLGLAVREGMTNILRHADADQATFTIVDDSHGLSIDIKDNGKTSQFSEGSGLAGLRKRIEDIGGSVDYQVRNGMCISIALPSSMVLND